MAKHSGNDTQDKEHFCKERTAIEKEELRKKKKLLIAINRTTFSEPE